MCLCLDYQSDSDSFNPTLWEEQRQQRMTVAFDFEDKKEEEDNSGKVKVGSMYLSITLFLNNQEGFQSNNIYRNVIFTIRNCFVGIIF